MKGHKAAGMDFEVAVALGYVRGNNLPKESPWYIPKLSPWRIRWNHLLAWLRPNDPPRVQWERPTCDVRDEQRSHLPLREAHKLLKLIQSSNENWKASQVSIPSDPVPEAKWMGMNLDALKKVEKDAEQMVIKMTREDVDDTAPVGG